MRLKKGTAVHSEGTRVLKKGTAVRSEGTRVLKKRTAVHSEGTRLLKKGTAVHSEGTRVLKKGTAVHSEGTRVLKKGTAVRSEGTRIPKKGTAVLASGMKRSQHQKTFFIPLAFSIAGMLKVRRVACSLDREAFEVTKKTQFSIVTKMSQFFLWLFDPDCRSPWKQPKTYSLRLPHQNTT